MLPLEKLTRLRQTLHAHPEVSGQEVETARRIETYLGELKPDRLLTQLGGTGVLATFDSGLEGPTLLFRSELDALPIEEINTFSHRSVTQGISHKCGHDGHMAILCGLAEWLAQNRPQRGKVHLLFQPAEETGEGAQRVINNPRFEAIRPDMAIALHNFPGFPRGAVVVRNSTFTAAVGSLAIHLQGRTSHASEPEHGLNPTAAIMEILQQSQVLNRPNPSDPSFQLITVVYVRVGSPAYGVSAGAGEMHLTLRAWTDTGLEQLRSNIAQLAQQIGNQQGLEVHSQKLQTFYANDNHAAAMDEVRKAAKTLDLALIEQADPFKGGEDFGLISSRFKGAMFGLGAGEDMPALHNPDYDFPDDLIEPGVQMFASVIRQMGICG